MQLTDFAPIFVVMLFWACFGARQWLAATLIASLFQGATPVLLTAGGRMSGIAPAYGLLGIGVLHWVLTLPQRRNAAGQSVTKKDIDAPLLWLAALTALAVAGAYLLPRIFQYSVLVMPPRWGLDTFLTIPLKPSSGNLIQAFFCTCNFGLFFLASRFVRDRHETLSFAIGALGAGALITALLGLYQVLGFYLGLPWPDAVINSNVGVSQPFAQTTAGVKRMSATFYEPSMLAMHFLALFGLLGLGLKRWGTATLLLICLLLSTSMTAYVGLSVLIALWGAANVRKMRPGSLTAVAFLGALLVLAALCVANMEHAPLLARENLVAGKLASESATARGFANGLAFAALRDSWGLGVGLGSTRASSLLATLAATVGLPGLIAMAGFLVTLLDRSSRCGQPEVNALGWGLFAALIGWLVSVPDLAVPMPWLIAGLAHGGLAPRSLEPLEREPVTTMKGEPPCLLVRI
jgi:hypothetical protein